jgi:hypothetical protein
MVRSAKTSLNAARRERRVMPMNEHTASIAPGADTISGFCKRNRISNPFYYKLRAQGLGPAELRALGVVRITAEAEAAWQRARTNPVGEEAENVARDADARRQRAKAAATSAVASIRHISRAKTRQHRAPTAAGRSAP